MFVWCGDYPFIWRNFFCIFFFPFWGGRGGKDRRYLWGVPVLPFVGIWTEQNFRTFK